MQPKTPASTVVRSLNDDHQAFRENIYDTDLTDEQLTRNYEERLNFLESQLVQLRDRKVDISRNLSKLQNSKQTAEVRLEQLRTLFNEDQVKLRQFEEQIKTNNEDLQSTQHRIAALRNSMASLNASISSLSIKRTKDSSLPNSKKVHY